MTALPDLSIEFVQALLPFIAVGFLAQLVDGALGMAFGLITNLMLVGMVGLAPARASANVHLVECFTVFCTHGFLAKNSKRNRRMSSS
jgi:uncharacterized membrane protein YfcA